MHGNKENLSDSIRVSVENYFFSLHHNYLYKQMYKLQIANSREEFFRINKESMISFYTKQNGISEQRIAEVIYDYKN